MLLEQKSSTRVVDLTSIEKSPPRPLGERFDEVLEKFAQVFEGVKERHSFYAFFEDQAHVKGVAHILASMGIRPPKLEELVESLKENPGTMVLKRFKDLGVVVTRSCNYHEGVEPFDITIEAIHLEKISEEERVGYL